MKARSSPRFSIERYRTSYKSIGGQSPAIKFGSALYRLKRHAQSVAWLRDRPHLPIRRVARIHCDAEILQEMAGKAFCLHVGEVQPQAHMRAAAERYPGEAVPIALCLFGEAQRIEAFRLGPNA